VLNNSEAHGITHASWKNRTLRHQTKTKVSFHGDCGASSATAGAAVHLILDPFPAHRILRSPIPTEPTPINYAQHYDVVAPTKQGEKHACQTFQITNFQLIRNDAQLDKKF